jgi:nucleoside-diphosphate-sugar epimerase
MTTILGASGFIGSHLVKTLTQTHSPFYAPQRNEDLTGKDLGDVIYCIGLTADFRQKPFETIEAHVSKLAYILENTKFKSFTYLSSTRVYIHNKEAYETSTLLINPNDPFDIFNSSKLTGELLALNSGKPNIKIARISNVYGLDFNSNNFLTSIIKDAILKKSVLLQTTLTSSKDYISVNDVANMVLALSEKAITGIFNVSSGNNVSNEVILNIISKATEATYSVCEGAKEIIIPIINNEKILSELNYSMKSKLEEDIIFIINQFEQRLN